MNESFQYRIVRNSTRASAHGQKSVWREGHCSIVKPDQLQFQLFSASCSTAADLSYCPIHGVASLFKAHCGPPLRSTGKAALQDEGESQNNLAEEGKLVKKAGPAMHPLNYRERSPVLRPARPLPEELNSVHQLLRRACPQPANIQ